MTPRAEVESLKDISLDVIASLVSLNLVSVYEACRVDYTYNFPILEKAVAKIVLTFSSPTLQWSLCGELLDRIHEITHEKLNEYGTQNLPHYNIICAIIHGLKVHPEQTETELSYILPNFYNNLFKLKKVTKLNVTESKGDPFSMKKNLVNYLTEALIYMPYIKHIVLKCYISDDIIRVIGKYGSKIEQLIIHKKDNTQHAVTDRCISCLIKCQRLRVFEIHIATSISSRGFLEIISGIPSLETVDICGPDISEILRCAEPHKTIKSNITEIYGHITAPSLIAKHLINLTRIGLDCSDITESIYPLVYLPRLAHVELNSADFNKCEIRRFIRAKGRQLLTLEFELLDNFEYKDFLFIGRQCPNLTNLHLSNYALSGENTISPEHFKEGLFKELEYFHHSMSYIDTLALQFLLANCHNIKTLSLNCSMNFMNDQIMASIFKFNPMSKLKELDLNFCNDITVATIYKFIEYCPDLTVITGLELCDSITQTEMNHLLDYIKKNNYALELQESYYSVLRTRNITVDSS